MSSDVEEKSKPKIKTVCLVYCNSSKKELVFADCSFLTYEHLPLDYLKLFKKTLVINGGGLFYKGVCIGTIEGRLITWVTNELSKVVELK